MKENMTVMIRKKEKKMKGKINDDNSDSEIISSDSENNK
jgi:hypothetical protein